MSEVLDRLINLADPAAILATTTQYEATGLIRELRQAANDEPARRRAYRRAAYRLAEVLHAQQPDNIVVTTVFAAVVKDSGDLCRAAEILANRLRDDCDNYYLNVVGSVLWHSGFRTSALFAFDLAQQYAEAGNEPFAFTNETLETLRARLRGTWLPDNAFFRLCEDGTQPVITDEELAKLEAPIPIPGLEGFTLRPLKSKRQLARVANQLRNCLNSYFAQVVRGTTLIFAVERNGVPVEAIEVNPATRRIVQWKGPSNCAPNRQTQAQITQVLAGATVPTEPRQPQNQTGVQTNEAPF